MSYNNGRLKLLATEYGSFRPKVREFFHSNILENANSFFDPWSGTAPFIPSILLHGKSAFYNDIMPLHFFVNKAKQYKIYLKLIKSKDQLKKELLKCLKKLDKVKFRISEDIISPDILNYFCDAWIKTSNYECEYEIFLKAMILLSIRYYSNFVESGTHPHWLMKGSRPKNVDLNDVVNLNVELMFKYYNYYYLDKSPINNIGNIHFECSNSLMLNPKQKFDVIFTSPSYRNSTDLYNMYLPELHFLSKVGYDISKTDFIGTNIVKDYKYEKFESDLKILSNLSPVTRKFIDIVIERQREKSYYYPRVFTRHYIRLFKSIERFMAFLKPNGDAYFVVQSNFHRGQENDMKLFITDFITNIGLKYKTEVTGEFHHLGKRNISKTYPLTKDKLPEQIIKVYR